MVVSEEQKRSHINQKKRKAEENPHANMVAVGDIDEEQISSKDDWKTKMKEKYFESEGSRVGENKLTYQSNALPSCIDKLREELSCAICLEVCYEPTSTWCGHSFCRRCLLFAATKWDKKCPECRRVRSKGQANNVNTDIWNTIQLLFPQEMEARKVAIENDTYASEGSRVVENKLTHQSNALPSCIEKLRDELSCAICLEICYEPTSTWCGHSFCRRCLGDAKLSCEKKCPKCRQILRKCRWLRLNKVMWNTIKLLFPREVEARRDVIMDNLFRKFEKYI